MRARHRPILGVVAACAALTFLAVPIHAQLISLKTVPLATGEQFQLFPSECVGLGSAGFALHDALRDPVSSPATGARLEGVHVFSSPVLYDYASRSGGGLTLPAGVFGSGNRFFGGIAGAIQELRPTAVAGNWDPWFGGGLVPASGTILPPSVRDDSRLNTYGFALAGVRLGARDAVAVSGFGAGLEAVQGVEEMYDGSIAIVQDGWLLDVRLGWLHEFRDDGSLDVVLLHDFLDMTHDVAYENPLAFDPVSSPIPVFTWEHNPDRTRTLGAHARYARPIDEEWSVGVVMTVNRKTHPKIPNYRIMNIPRDPGVSTALDLGVGVSRERDGVVVAVDGLIEPAWTETWAVAEEPILHWDSLTVLVQPGERSVENHFRFMNGVLRLAVSADRGIYTVGAGLAMRTIGYHMTQYRFNQPWWLRRQDERWIEWTPTWGAAMDLPGLHLRYDGSVTFGTGVNRGSIWRFGGVVDAASGTDFIPAPDRPLNFDQLTVWTHMLSVSLGSG